MEKTIYIHIGPHKTGTTTIQKGLLLNEHVLHTMDVLVPSSGRTMTETAGHHNLAWQLLDLDKFDPTYGTWDDLIKEIENSGEVNTVILSAEAFCLLNESAIEKIREVLKGYQIKIIIYLRSPDQALQSSWVSQVRNSFVLPKIRSFHEWLEVHEFKSKNTDYYAMIKRWEKVFLRESLILVPFAQKSVGHNLFEHFLSLCNVSGNGITTPPNLNLSPGVKTIEAMRMIKNSIPKSDFDPSMWTVIANNIVAYGNDVGWNNFKLNYLDKKTVRKIWNHHRKTNHKIEAEYFDNHPIFERTSSKMGHVDRFTYDQFSKDEMLGLFSFILGKLAQEQDNTLSD